MKKTISKSMAWLLSVVMIFGAFVAMPIKSANAYTSHSRDEAVDWARSKIGSKIDVDGYYGAQCVDLIMAYYEYLGVSRVSGNGCDYSHNSLPSGWTRIQNTPSFVPEPGDIVVWTDAGWQYGHVAIFLSGNTSSFTSIDQNWPKGSEVKEVSHNYNYVWGVIRPDFTSKENKCDLGTDFYAYIINSEAWKMAAVVGNNVQLQSETGFRNQLWYFERQDDLYYKITNVGSNGCLDVHDFGDTNGTNIESCGSNDSSAQRWCFVEHNGNYVLHPKCSPSMALDLNGGATEDGTNIHLWETNGTYAQDYNIWKITNTPRTPTVTSASDKYSLGSNVQVYWGENAFATYYWVDVWHNGEHTESFSSTDISYTLNNVTVGNYTVFVRSCNPFDVSDTGSVSFTVYNQVNDNYGYPVDMGSEFYATIKHQSTGMYLTNQQNNVAGEKRDGTKRQLWRFERLSNGAYKIQSVLDNYVLDVYGAYDDNDVNIYTYAEYVGGSNQQFYIYNAYGACYIRPVHSANKMLDMSLSDNHNVSLWVEGYDWDPQEFDITTVDTSAYVMNNNPIDLGTNFYANIEHQTTGMYLTNQENNVAGEAKDGSKRQIWKFERLSNGAYKIKSVLDNTYIDIYSSQNENNTNIQTWEGHDGANQNFYIYSAYDAYYFRPACSYDKMVDMALSDYNVSLWDAGYDLEPQEFNIIKIDYDENPIKNTSVLAADNIKLGTYITVNASATGGTGDYTYAVYYKKASASSWTTKQKYSTNATVTFKPASVEKYNISVKVKDSSGKIVKKAFTVNVYAPLKNTSAVASANIGFGDSITVKAKATGGIGKYKYEVYYKQESAAKWTRKQSYSTNNTVSFKPKAATTYDVSVKVKDSNGTVVKKRLKVNVTKPENTSTIKASTISLGESIRINCSGKGGSGYYQYAVYYKRASATKWSTKQNYSANTSVSIKPSAKTTYNVCVKVKDSLGNILKKTFNVTVK